MTTFTFIPADYWTLSFSFAKPIFAVLLSVAAFREFPLIRVALPQSPTAHSAFTERVRNAGGLEVREGGQTVLPVRGTIGGSPSSRDAI